ncbi:NADH-quinone oxidoreductase subunit C [Streptomyces sp. NPDC020807]|uniref:NADH-quinone oxidoreductase subunit C n=1 Tax=Streptomyces sp. NPDC020807 TaxID=3155119 RepID=UPI0033EB1315
MNAYDSLPEAVTELFGEEATAEQAYDLLTVDVPPASWIDALTTARDGLGCTFFDWLSAVDEPGTGFRICAHVVSLADGRPRRLLVRTTVPHEAAALPTAIGVYAGAGWHERETHEMFGVDFTGHPHLVPLLLPENFEGHPLRKDFVLAARVAKAWPGAKEPGESHDGGGPKRRQMLPPGVPDPNEWGPLKGQLPPAPARPARAAAGERPARRARTVAEGSASQADPTAAPTATADAGSPAPPRPPRRTRSVTEGSASQAERTPTTPDASTPPSTPDPSAPDPSAPVRRSRSASEGSASQTAPTAPPGTNAPGTNAPEPAAPAEPGAGAAAPAARPPRRSRSASDGSVSQGEPTAAPEPGTGTAPTPRTRSSDAPWHHARPAFDEAEPAPKAPAADPAPDPDPAPESAEPAEGADAPAEPAEAPHRTDATEPTEPTNPAGGDPA